MTVTDRIIRLPEVLHRVGLGKSYLYKMIRAGEFPRPVKIGRVSAWVESDVQRWIAERAGKGSVQNTG